MSLAFFIYSCFFAHTLAIVEEATPGQFPYVVSLKVKSDNQGGWKGHFKSNESAGKFYQSKMVSKEKVCGKWTSQIEIFWDTMYKVFT